jgi:hypothetical protein
LTSARGFLSSRSAVKFFHFMPFFFHHCISWVYADLLILRPYFQNFKPYFFNRLFLVSRASVAACPKASTKS